MRPVLRSLLFFLLLLPPVIAAPASLVAVPRSLADREARIAGNGSTGPYALGATLVLPGSEKITRGDRLLVPGLDYSLDHDKGLLTLSQPLLAGQEIAVVFQVIPFQLAPRYTHREPAEDAPPPGDSGARRAVATGESRGTPAASGAGVSSGAGALAGLTIGGTKTISLGVGSGRDFSVDQELNLTIAGRLTPDVEVKALLSDRNLPIQPEGTTRELDRLDQVRVEVTGPHGEVALGDYETSLGAGTEFGLFARELQGVRASVFGRGSGVSAGTAVARGKFRRAEFMGIEGRQGPYALTDDAGAAEIVVLAGSETVWLDGRQLERGDDNDYTIDYSRGRLEFTRRHLITAESRIAVDYQFANEAFRRNLVFGSMEQKLGNGRFRIAALTLREADDVSATRGAPLTASDRSLLAASGDGDVFAPGWQRADSVPGEYTIAAPPDTTGDSLLVYVGPGAGSHNARFTQVASGAGWYARKYDDVALRYYYEYSPGGDYIPRVRVSRPRSLAVGDLRAEFTPRTGVVFSGEIAGSRNDRNTLSSRDDGDNDDRAISASGALRSIPLRVGGGSLGRFSLSGRLRDVGGRFAAPGAATPAFFGADWNLQGARRDASGLSAVGEEALRELKLEYLPVAALTLRGSAGTLRREGNQRARRREWGAETRWPRGGTIALASSHVTNDRGDTTGVADVLHVSQNRSAGRLYTEAEFTRDIREDRRAGVLGRGLAFREGAGRAGFGDPAATHVEGSFRERRNREVRTGSWRPRSVAREGGLEAVWSRARGHLTARLTRRTVDADPAVQDEHDSRTDLAEITTHDLIGPRDVSSDFAYRISNTAEETEERRFVRVGPGADYDSLGNYMPGEGEFAPIRVPTGSLPVTAVEMSTRVRWSGRGRLLGGESFVGVEERSRESDRWRLYLLQPGVLQKEGVSLFGRIQLRQDLVWNEDGDPASVRLRLEHRRERDFRVVNHSLTRRSDREELRVRGAPRPGLTVEGTLAAARSVSALAGGAGGDESLASWSLSADSKYQVTRPLELALAGAASTHHDRVTGRDLRSVELGPGASYAVGSRARVEAGLIGRKSSGIEDGALPVSGFGVIRRSGLEWRLSLDYRVSRTIQGTLRYNGSDLGGRPIEHRGNAEFRAFF